MVRATFDAWLAKFERVYTADAAELARRFAVFRDNWAYVAEYNRARLSHWLGLGAYADLTHDEFRAGYVGRLQDPRPKGGLLGLRAPTGFSYADSPVKEKARRPPPLCAFGPLPAWACASSGCVLEEVWGDAGGRGGSVCGGSYLVDAGVRATPAGSPLSNSSEPHAPICPPLHCRWTGGRRAR